MDNSKPSKGKKTKNPAPIPKSDANPTPQATHPGARTPKNIPNHPNKPTFLFSVMLNLDLNKIKLIRIPNKMLIIIKLIKEWKIIVDLKPSHEMKKKFMVPKKPRLGYRVLRFCQLEIKTLNE